MTAIDASARVADGARIGDGVEIGPYCLVGPHVELKDGVRLVAHVNVTGATTIGEGTIVYPFASLGTPPQSVHYRGEPTKLVIGPRCEIREGVTMNIGTAGGGGITRVGARGFFMVASHVGHDCDVGDDVTFANNAVLGGHVTIGNDVFLGGNSAVHQFVRIGEGVMVGGLAVLRPVSFRSVLPKDRSLHSMVSMSSACAGAAPRAPNCIGCGRPIARYFTARAYSPKGSTKSRRRLPTIRWCKR